MLVRSGIEIARLLKEMLADADTLTANLRSGEVLFISRLLAIEEEDRYIVLACAEHKHANSALLEARKVHLHCSHRGLYYGFAAASPREIQQRAVPAMRLAFPDALLAQQRRSAARVSVAPVAIVRCEVPLGVLSFEASVTDISMGGIGMLAYGAGIQLKAGMRIEKVEIEYPGRKPVLVDLEIRHVAKVMLPDGRLAHRAGCRILASQQVMEDLARLFITKLD